MSDAGGGRPRALILVRNTVSHDARILREAATLRGLGHDVLIAGVVSTDERTRSVEIEGHQVVRLDPLGALKRLVPGRRPTATITAEGAPVRSGTAADGSERRGGVGTVVRRLAVTAAYYVQGAALLRRFRPGLVHANDYNTMWMGIFAKAACGSRVVYDCHELWADRNGGPEWRPWLIACEWVFMRVADATITASPGYADELARRYRVARPTVVRNIPVLAGDGAGRVVEAGLFVYVGGLMPGRGLEQAIRALAQTDHVRLRLIGPGNAAYRASLERCAVDAGVADRVSLVAAVAPDAVLDAVAGATAGLMLIEPVCRSYELTLPNKLFEYAAAGVPILASDMPVLGGIVAAEGLGEVVQVDDVAAVARGMERLASADVNAAVRSRVRAFAGRETWEHESSVLAGVYSGDERSMREREP